MPDLRNCLKSACEENIAVLYYNKVVQRIMEHQCVRTQHAWHDASGDKDTCRIES